MFSNRAYDSKTILFVKDAPHELHTHLIIREITGPSSYAGSNQNGNAQRPRTTLLSPPHWKGEFQMESYLDQGCSFIVKIWVEEKDEESGCARWRGYVTHVLSGKRQYFENIPTAFEFVLPYLEAMGIKIETGNLPGITRCS